MTGVTIDGNRNNGVESDAAGSTDLIVDSARLVKNGDGVLLGAAAPPCGWSARPRSATAGTASRSAGAAGSRFRTTPSTVQPPGRRRPSRPTPRRRRLRRDRAAGHDHRPAGRAARRGRLGHRRFPAGAPHPAAGGAGRLQPPRGCATTAGSTSVITLRFGLAPTDLAAVRDVGAGGLRGRPARNPEDVQVVPGTRLLPGGQVEITLTDPQIASATTPRFATYGPLAPPNLAPVIGAVYPAQGARCAVARDCLGGGERRRGAHHRPASPCSSTAGAGAASACATAASSSASAAWRGGTGPRCWWSTGTACGRPAPGPSRCSTAARPSCAAAPCRGRELRPHPGRGAPAHPGAGRPARGARPDPGPGRRPSRARPHRRGPAGGPGPAGPGPSPDRGAGGRPRRGGRHPRLGLPRPSAPASSPTAVRAAPASPVRGRIAQARRGPASQGAGPAPARRRPRGRRAGRAGARAADRRADQPGRRHAYR